MLSLSSAFPGCLKSRRKLRFEDRNVVSMLWDSGIVLGKWATCLLVRTLLHLVAGVS